MQCHTLSVCLISSRGRIFPEHYNSSSYYQKFLLYNHFLLYEDVTNFPEEVSLRRTHCYSYTCWNFNRLPWPGILFSPGFSYIRKTDPSTSSNSINTMNSNLCTVCKHFPIPPEIYVIFTCTLPPYKFLGDIHSSQSLK